MITRRGFLKFLAATPLIKIKDLAPKLPVPQRDMVVGDVFTIAGVYAINPITRDVISYTDPKTGTRVKMLRRFVVTGPNMFFPPIISSGQFMNCEIRKGADLSKKIPMDSPGFPISTDKMIKWK